MCTGEAPCVSCSVKLNVKVFVCRLVLGTVGHQDYNHEYISELKTIGILALCVSHLL